MVAKKYSIGSLERTFRLFVLFFAFFILPWTGPFLAEARSEDQVYKVGVVPQFEVRRILQIWTPILEAVSQKTGLKLEIEPSPGIPEFEAAFEEGVYDFAYMNPYHLLVANRTQGYTPLIRDIGRMLYGIIVVKKDGPIKTIQELEGKSIAFPAPNALGAALIPRAEFASVYHIDYKPVYVKSHTSVYLNVLLGRTDAGGGVQSTFNSQKPEVINGLKVIHETIRIAPHPIAAHPRVAKDVQKIFVSGILSLASTPEGSAMLAQAPIRKAGLAKMEDYRPLIKLNLDRFYVKAKQQ